MNEHERQFMCSSTHLRSKADAAKLALLKKEACRENGISDRTLRRWLLGYKESGFAGLKPAGRSGVSPGVIPEDLIAEAILLRREVPPQYPADH